MEARSYPRLRSRPTTCFRRLRPTPRSGRAARALLLTGDRDLYQCVRDGVSVLYLQHGRERRPEVVDAAEVERTLRRPRRSGSLTSSPSAETRPTGYPERRGSARRRRPTCFAATGRSRARSPAPCASARRAFAAPLHDSGRRAADVQGHRDTASGEGRQKAADRKTDYAAGARAVHELGMKRLSDRVRQQAR